MTIFEAVKALPVESFAHVLFSFIKVDNKTEEELIEALNRECGKSIENELRLQEQQLNHD